MGRQQGGRRLRAGLYTQNDGKIDGVVSANDTMAGGIIARLKANGLAGKVPITGQDASTRVCSRSSLAPSA